jgi:DNA-binding LacI/PurR family transcriptional regulator
MALGCLATLDKLGVKVPTDLSVVGFDDSAGARFSRPPLTSVRPPLVEMASEATRILIKWEGVHDLPGSSFPCELIVRESTAPPPRE